VTHPQEPQHPHPPVSTQAGSPEPVSPDESTTTWIPPAYAEPQTDRSHEPPAPPAQPNVPPTGPHYSTAPDDPPPSEVMAASMKTGRRFLRDPMLIILILVIVVALLIASPIAAELYARKRAADVVAAAAQCELNDKVKVSFGPSPFLLQHFTGHYTDISIQTAGNQIRTGKGMRADITVNDVTLHGDAKSKGTIGAVDATIVWPSNAIKQTVADAVPFVSGLLNSITTSPADGTIQLSGALGLGSITLKPQVADGGLSLQVVEVTAMGTTVPHEIAQSALDQFTSKLMQDYPLGVRADSVQVTNDGVVGQFSARNVSMPANGCFARV
jgi:LmeA-like phospholipid-binding